MKETSVKRSKVKPKREEYNTCYFKAPIDSTEPEASTQSAAGSHS